jgi:RNA polymerase sigma-70 factor (ECF subfamily)
MASRRTASDSAAGVVREFRTTRWSVFLRAGNVQRADSLQALEKLSETYWYPLYAFVRRKGLRHEAAQDVTQAFFAKLLGKQRISLADPERGRFRTFLLHSMENFLRTQHRDATTQKRGGRFNFIPLDAGWAEEWYLAEPVEGLSESGFFERQWAGAVLESALRSLRAEFSGSGRAELFEALEPHLWGDDTSTPYSLVAQALKMTTVAVRVTVHRLRHRFHDLLREEVAQTVESPADVEEELRHLRRVLAS